MFRTALFTLLPLASILVPGCSSDTCTLIGCGFSLEVAFTGATAKPGRYRIDVVADGEASTCEVTLPRTCESQPTCASASLPWRLALSGCSIGDPQTIDGIVFPANAPLTVDLLVHRDDRIVGQTSVLPEYKNSRPNGPQCDPDCRTSPRFETALQP
jgi:hypothetical protein